MANDLHKKPFLDYVAQIEHLKQKQLVITDEPSAKTLELMGFPSNWMSILRINVYN